MSEKQLLANRQNALKSTGPRTEDGKAQSRLNATKHGGYTKVALQQDDIIRLNQTHNKLIAEFCPSGFEETYLISEIAEIILRKSWFKTAEAQMFLNYRFANFGKGDEEGDLGTAIAQDSGAYGAIPRCLAAEETLDRRLFRYFDRLRKLQEKRGFRS